MISKNNIIIAVFVVLCVLVVGVLINKKNTEKNRYSVVYMTTGEVYIGKLETFPRLELTDGYVLQLTKDEADPTKTKFQINPVSEAVWAPESLYLNRKNIVFYGPLSPTSKIAQTLAEKGK